MAGVRSLGTLTLDLVLKMGGFTAGMDRAERHADKRLSEIERRAYKFGQTIGTGLKVAGGVAAAGMTALTAVVANATRDVGHLGLELERFAKISNASTQEFQRWAAGAATVGISQEKLADQLKDFNEKAGEFQATGGGGMKDFFEKIAPQIGLTAEAFRNLSGPQAMQLYFDALEKANLNQQEMSFYLESMASDTTALIPLLQKGGDGFKRYGDEAEAMGVILDSKTIKATREMQATAAQLDQMMLSLKVSVAEQTLPALVRFGDVMRDPSIQGGIRDLANLIGTLSANLITGAGELARFTTQALQISKLSQGGSVKDADLDALQTRLGQAAKERRDLQNWDTRILGMFESESNDRIRSEGMARLKDEMQRLQREVSQRITADRFAGVTATVDSTYFPKPVPPKPATTGGGRSSRRDTSAEDAARRAEEMRRQAAEALADFERLAATLGGPLAEAEYQHMQNLEEITRLGKDASRTTAEIEDLKAKETKRYDEQTEAIRRQLDPGAELLANLQEELRLMGMTNQERLFAIETRGLDAEAIKKHGDEIRKTLGDLQAEGERVDMMDGWRSSFEGFVGDVLEGNQSIGDSFRDLFDNVDSMIKRRISKNIVDALFGEQGSTSGGASGDWLGKAVSWLGSWFGGGGRAAGGAISANSMYLVNETGLEMASVGGRDYLLTGGKGGYITPADRVGGGSTVVQNFYNPVMNNRTTEAQKAQEQAQFAQRHASRNA